MQELNISPASAQLSKISTILDGLYTQKEVISQHKLEVEKNPSAYPKTEIEHIEKRLEVLNAEIKEWKGLISQKPEKPKMEIHGSVPARLIHEPVYYADYIKLDKILSSQQLLSEASGEPAHDEMLFIITHQTYELWFKQIIFEIRAVMKIMDNPFVPSQGMYRAVHHLNRVNQILRVLVSQFDIMETMTPLDFLEFRDYLFPASGFQSFQFRLLENVLGLRAAERILHDKKAYHTKLSPIHAALVQEAENDTSLFALMEKWLERTPFVNSEDSQFNFMDSYKKSIQKMFEEDSRIIMYGVPEGEERNKELQRLEDNKRALIEMFDEKAFQEGKRGRLSFKATQAALLIFVYQEEPVFQIPYQFLQALIDVDENMTSWRYRHALLVHRIIGTKVGTGGSSGYWYLKSAIERSRIFVDLGNLCTFLIPRKDLPPLPESVKSRLGLVSENKN